MNCELIGWCSLTPEVQAAWVQAVGSVIAIAVAVAVPLSIAQRDRRRRALDDASRARTYALHLMPQADRLHSKLRSAQTLMMGADEEDLPQIIEMVRAATSLDGWGLHLHELGDAGGLLQRALAEAISALEILGDLAHYIAFNDTIIDDETGDRAEIIPPPPVEPHLDQAVLLAKQAVTALRELFN
ncbi:hypothetical protein [Stenotrophomonas sp.]|uniref:hypothetical protein n=1 Tax=Stenotrophomonas sp. TaxID=69392 RepID=UPI0028A5D39C|nr:hypothetical protein [Stenotrophomonas sp.]